MFRHTSLRSYQQRNRRKKDESIQKTVPSLISASFSIIELEKNQCLMYLITSGVLLLKYTVI